MFSLLAAIAKSVTTLLVPLAYKAGKFLKNAFFDSQDTSSLTYRVKEDERYQGALLEYVRAKDIRDRELIQLNAAQLERKNELKEQELKDKRELSALQRELMRELQAKEIEVKLTEIQTLWDKDTWFSKLSRQETEQILLQQQHRLLILLSPPEISEDCPASFRNNLRTEMRSVGAFLNEHYSPQDSLSPVKFYSDYFKEPIADIDVERLQRILSPVPTIILYSDISDYAVTFRIGFWGVGNKEATVFSTKHWNWEEAHKLLLEQGNSETQTFRIIRQLIVSIHKLLAAFWTDLYYLQIDPNYEPKLHQLSSELLEGCLAKEIVKPYLDALDDFQKQQLGIYQDQLKTLVINEVNSNTETAKEFKKEDFLSPKYKESRIIEKFKSRDNNLKKQADSFTLSHLIKDDDPSSINSIVFSPYGSILIGGNSGGFVFLWDSQNAEKIGLLRRRDAEISSIAINSNGQLVAIGEKGGTIELILLETGQILETLSGHSINLNSLAFSPSEEILASGGDDKKIKFWKIHFSQGENDSIEIQCSLLNELGFEKSEVYSVCFSSNGKVAAGSISLLKLSKFQIQERSDGTEGNEIIFDSDNTLSSIASSQKSIRSIAFSPNGQILASGAVDKTIKLWQVDKGKEFRTLNGHTDELRSIAFSPNGQILASAGLDKTVKLWRVDTGEELRTLSCEEVVLSVAFSSDGLMFAAGCGGGLIYIWRCEVGEESESE